MAGSTAGYTLLFLPFAHVIVCVIIVCVRFYARKHVPADVVLACGTKQDITGNGSFAGSFKQGCLLDSVPAVRGARTLCVFRHHGLLLFVHRTL